jgi:alkylhydroperoxidase/carboxymuconolactone decarboxylase family protein YurZ
VRAEDRERIRAEFIAQRGYWRPWVETLLESNPSFVEHYARYAGYPARTGPLSERMVELIYVALDSSGSHLFPSGLRTHMARALQVGATPVEVLDVLHLVAVQGSASVGQAASIVSELVCVAEPAPDIGHELQQRIAQVGPAHGLDLKALARRDPGYVEVLLDFVTHGRPQEGGLSLAERCLVMAALQACFTAFNPDAFRAVARTALDHGVEAAALLQAVQLGAHLAVHGTALGADTLREILSSSPT